VSTRTSFAAITRGKAAEPTLAGSHLGLGEKQRQVKPLGYLRYLDLRLSQVLTPEARAEERMRRVTLSVLTLGIARFVGLVAALITVPLTVHYLGVERYGMWITISSVASFLTFADLGMGNGLLNAIAGAHARDDVRLAREYVSSAFFMLCAMAVLVCFAFMTLYPWVSWPQLFNVSSPQAKAEAGPALLVLVGCFVANVPLGIIQKIQQGYQDGFINSLWVALGNIVSLVAVLAAVHLHASLPWLLLTVTGAPIAGVLLNGVFLFGFQRPWLRPRWADFRLKSAKEILSAGLLFLAMQAGVAVSFSSDNIVAAQMIGPAAVTTLSVPGRLFSVVPAIMAMIFSALWPAYGESLTRGEVSWVKHTLRSSLGLALMISGSISLVLTVFSQAIIHVWVGSSVVPGFPLLVGLGVWTVLFSVGSALAMVLNAANAIRFQAVCWLFIATLGLVAKISMSHSLGVAGIVWANNLVYTLLGILPMVALVPRILADRGTNGSAA
jgi:O-antigen/teichoic acid export membrane protein